MPDAEQEEKEEDDAPAEPTGRGGWLVDLIDGWQEQPVERAPLQVHKKPSAV